MPLDPLPILTAVGALALVLAGVFAAQFLLRRLRLAPGGPASRRLAIIETLAIDPRRRLLLVGCEDRRFLLLVGGGQDLLLEAREAGR